MHYIVLDLEWDSGYYPEEGRFVNQILQIGAVKLDGALNLEDSFDVTIRSGFTKRVSGRFARLTGITTEKMRAGVPYEEAVRRYNAWAGSDTVTMTWSTSDLYALLENERFLPDGLRLHLEKYLDLQQYIQNELTRAGYESRNQIALAHAAELLGVSTESFDLHTARDDSLVSVALLRRTYDAARFSELIRDTADPAFYRRLCFKPYYLNDLNDPLIDRNELRFYCTQCGARLRHLGRWKYRNRHFSARLHCRACDKVYCASISFRKNFDGVAVKKRLTEPQEEPKNEVQSVSTPLSQ